MDVYALFAIRRHGRAVGGMLSRGLYRAIRADMSEKKRGRPNTHLSERPYALRFAPAMFDAMKAAATREGLTMAAWLREAIRARLPK